jgi:surfactin synthase thioesterase subunit
MVNGPTPGEIVVSARDPPSLAYRRLKDFGSDQEIIAEVRRPGGLTAELIENQDFQNFAMLACGATSV